MNKITEAMLDEWVKLYEEGYYYTDIANIYNVSRHTVTNYLKPMNLKHLKKRIKIPQSISMKMINEWIELVKNKTMNSYEIALKYGVGRGTVIKYVYMFGYTFSRNIAHRQVYNTMICLYDKNDTLVYCFDNIYEMSKKLNRSYDGLQSAISRYRNGKSKGNIFIKGVKYQIELIAKENEDEDRTN